MSVEKSKIAEIEIIYASEKFFRSFHESLGIVARERVYIEMIEAPPLDAAATFQSELISRNAPVYYAVTNDRVVGWCDIFPHSNPRQCHRGSLGMGLVPEFRNGQSLVKRFQNYVEQEYLPLESMALKPRGIASCNNLPWVG